ncbi:Bifunctional inhibitor/lipid-transfer protein/seed storage 2S albumin protein [Dioscorea alata]|uniref:Bifunctional inhibitor/lipid-transfer protein/seed storage 2S albumin protein n=1 Tax=Dioscorea alata TaxID=55571 RepID=A0ACB7UDM2_DIOAL|nr:Bifunctional inhibitor/lipid-transfer protein/seed storage 2S albumin protein [Dioscorea alata]
MKMKPLFVLSFISMVLLLLLFLLQSSTVMSVDCNVGELICCADPISTGVATQQCCSKLKEQEPCLCQYKNNPFFGGYVNSPNAKKVAQCCGVPFPSC